MTHQETMTSRERVRLALDHQEADRIPIDLGGFQTGIHRLAYRDLIDYLGLHEKPAILDPIQQLVVPSEQVLQFLRCDVRYLGANAPAGYDEAVGPDGPIVQRVRWGQKWHDLRDEWGVVWSMPDRQGLYMDISHHPLAEATLADLDRYPFPDGSDPSRFAGLRERALALHEGTTYAISSAICGVTYEICWYLRGLERWFVDTIENPAFCEALLDRTSHFWVQWLTGFLKEVGDLLDVVMIGDDLSGQSGPLFSPRFYRSVVRPRQQRVIDTIKRHSAAKIWYHTCGDCSAYIPDFIEMGIDALNPVQTSVPGMDAQTLKRRWGDEIVFWGGGIDAQHVLPFATPIEVRCAVAENVQTFKPGGGYVFNNVHNIQAGVPPENIVAMYEAAYEFGFYD